MTSCVDVDASDAEGEGEEAGEAVKDWGAEVVGPEGARDE